VDLTLDCLIYSLVLLVVLGEAPISVFESLELINHRL
jgi:hypothetical protein